MKEKLTPSLFGIRRSNRDFSLPDSWGKNQFNSSFPVALICYMGEKKIPPVYLVLGNNLTVQHSKISSEKLLGLPHNSNNLFFSFEECFTPYSDLVIGPLARADLVTRNSATENKDCLAAFEIKLTALPDSSTYDTEDESLYGCEIVVRPDTIVYIALSVARLYAKKREELKAIISPASAKVEGWEDADNVRPHLGCFSKALDNLLQNNLENQTPLLLQSIWKTQGKKGGLSRKLLRCICMEQL